MLLSMGGHMKKIRISYDEIAPVTGNITESGWINKEGIDMPSTVETIIYLKEQGALYPNSSVWVDGIFYSTEGTTSTNGTAMIKRYFLDGYSEFCQRSIFKHLSEAD